MVSKLTKGNKQMKTFKLKGKVQARHFFNQLMRNDITWETGVAIEKDSYHLWDVYTRNTVAVLTYKGLRLETGI